MNLLYGGLAAFVSSGWPVPIRTSDPFNPKTEYQRGGIKMCCARLRCRTWASRCRKLKGVQRCIAVLYLVDVASDEEAVDDQTEAEPHREDSSVPVAARCRPQAEHWWDEIESCALIFESKLTTDSCSRV